jgi:CRP-like cAMP-binding protein
MKNRFIDKLCTFSALQADDVAALAAATAVSTKNGSKKDLIREGDRPGPVFVVLEGWACRYKILPSGTRQILGFLMPGDSCDLHVALLAEMDHSIQTLTPALVAKIERADMDKMLASHPKIANAMYISQLVDEGTMRSWITSMGRRTSVERVSHLLSELYIRASNIGLPVSPQFEMPLSQLILADALGMTPVHLNRVLKNLRLRGALTVVRGRVGITDPELLIQIAGFDENYLHRRLRAKN